MAACGFDHHRAMASGSSPSPGPTRCPSESRPAHRPDRVARVSPSSGSTRPRTSATSCTASRCSPRSFLSRTRTPTSAPSPTRSRAWSGTTSPPKPDHDYTYVFHPLARHAEESRPSRGRRSRSGPDRATFRRGCTSVLQPRRRLEPGVRAGVRQHVAQRPAVAGQAPEGPAVAEPGSRRGDDRVHQERPQRRCDPWMLLRVHLSAGTRGARQGNRPTASTCSSSSTASRTSTPRTRAARRHRKSRVLRERSAAEELAAIADAGLPASAVIRREARRSDLAHNKFMVLLAGRSANPAAGLDRIHQPHRRRDPRPGQHRPLDPGRTVAAAVRSLLGAPRDRSRWAAGRQKSTAREEQGVLREASRRSRPCHRDSTTIPPGPRPCSARAPAPAPSTCM